MILLFVTLLLTWLTNTTLQAGGVFFYEIGTPEVGLASAGWSARAEDASTLFTNPAGMTRLSQPQCQLGIEPIYNRLRFHPNSSTTVRGSKGNASAWIPSGSFFCTTPLNDKVSIGFGSLGYWGSSLNYGKHWVGRYYVEKVTLQGFSLVPAIAVKLTDRLSIGLGANVMYGIFKNKCAIHNLFDDGKDGQMRLHDHKIRTGFIAGVLYEVTPQTRVGIQYISRVKLPFHDKPKFSNLGPILTALLAATGITINDVTMKIKVPQSVMASIYHEINPTIAILANAGWQQWSKFGTTEISLSNAPIASISAPIKLKNCWHGALGFQITCNPSNKILFGAAYDSSIVTKKNRTFSLPVGRQWRYGIGYQHMFKNKLQISAGYELLNSGTLHVSENKGLLTGRVAGAFRKATTQFFTLTFTKSF